MVIGARHVDGDVVEALLTPVASGLIDWPTTAIS
jgi:hypothetical protein